MIDFKKIAIYALIACCLALCSIIAYKQEIEKTQLSNVTALNSELKNYKLKNGQLVLSSESLQYNVKQLKEHILNKDAKLKEVVNKFSNVKSTTKYITKTVLDTINIIYKDTVPCIYEKIDAIFEDDFSLQYKSTQKGITIMELSIPDSVIMVVGKKRRWFLGKETLKIDMTHSNKFVETEYVQHAEIVVPKKWYERTLPKFLAGFILGGILIK